MFADNYKIVGKHNTYYNVPINIIGNFEEKLKVGNIRNPWDWYVSLWAFGCQNKGGLYSRLVKNKSYITKRGIKHLLKRSLGLEYSQINPEIWRELYSDPNNHENFNSWLSLILSSDKHSIGVGYKRNKMSKFSGLLTYRYLKLYTYRKQFTNIDSEYKLEKYDIEENFMDFIIKNENINEALIELADKLDYNIDALSKILGENQEKTNKSNRNRDYRPYYDDKSISLVAKYDNYIINKYNYRFE